MPQFNFEVATRSAVGLKLREALPEQRSRLQTEFKTRLIRVYAGALSQVRDQTVEVLRTVPVPGGTQVVVQTEVRGRGEPIKLDYRLDMGADAVAWKIIDVNVGGLWLVQNCRTQFAQELGKGVWKASSKRSRSATRLPAPRAEAPSGLCAVRRLLVGQQHQALDVEPQRLDDVAAPAAEDENVSLGRVLCQRRLHPRGYAVEALPYLGMAGDDPHPRARWKTKHGRPITRWQPALAAPCAGWPLRPPSAAGCARC